MRTSKLFTQKKSLLTILLLICLILTGMIYSNSATAQIKIGVFADCQYCDCETAGSRFYRNSLSKLEDCITEFNQTEKLKFVVGLGDLIDRDFNSFDSVNVILQNSKKKVYHVIGNHDLEVEKTKLELVPSKVNLSETWYSFTQKGWHFIFLNGNDITFHSNNQDIVKQAKEVTSNLKKEDKPNYYEWNGGIGSKQMEWFERELQKANDKKRNVVVFCHYPLLPIGAHSLWNTEEVIEIINNYKCVKAWINGHNHAGNYTMNNGIHFITLQGMVDTEKDNAFAIVSISDKEIVIDGFGRELDRKLPIK